MELAFALMLSSPLSTIQLLKVICELVMVSAPSVFAGKGQRGMMGKPVCVRAELPLEDVLFT